MPNNQHAAILRDMAEREESLAKSYAETAPDVSAAYERRAAALLAGAEALEAATWRPIETAPKNGAVVLLYAPSFREEPERVTCGHYEVNEGYIREHRDFQGNYLGQDESEGYEGWLSWDGGFTDEWPPTCWRPMPLPPTADKHAALARLEGE